MMFAKFLKNVTICFLLSCTCFLSAVFIQMNAPTESSRWIYEINQAKSNLAHSINEPKLIVLSGSNSLFGMSCKTIQEDIQIPCVNAATNAGLGLDYILSFGRSLARPGDTFLLPLEYGMYQYDGKHSDVLIDYIFARDPGYLNKIGFESRMRAIGGISFSRLMRGTIYKVAKISPRKDGYQSDTLNEYGDETRNTVASITEAHRQKLNRLQPMEKINGSVDSSHGMQSIRDFVRWCRDNNIQVLASWPSTVWFEAYNQPSRREYFKSIKNFYQSLDIPILGQPQDFMYDVSLFYDTAYHLNDRGMHQRTEQVISLLQPYLQPNEKLTQVTKK